MNRTEETRTVLKSLGVKRLIDVSYDLESGIPFEYLLDDAIMKAHQDGVDEVVIDTSAMTKFAILLSIVKCAAFKCPVRLVYSEAEHYAPTKKQYITSKRKLELLARFPSLGVRTILRAICLSSIRMQGQPVNLVAFTSFNEQLVSHLIGTLNPHRLVFINGRPPRPDYSWREKATQEIHAKLIDEYSRDNPLSSSGALTRVTSTLDYRETTREVMEIYNCHGLYERIICAATGSKMQTIGLALSKLQCPDIHIEYPTPDSYYVKGLSTGVRQVHEVCFRNLHAFHESTR